MRLAHSFACAARKEASPAAAFFVLRLFAMRLAHCFACTARKEASPLCYIYIYIYTYGARKL